MSHGPAALARTLCACNVFVRKAAALPEYAAIDAYEEALGRAMFAEWAEKANVALARAVRKLPRTGKITKEQADGLADTVIDGFTGWPSRDLRALVGDTVAGVYRLSSEVIAKRVQSEAGKAVEKADDDPVDLQATFESSFSLTDEKAITEITDSQIYWLGQHFDDDTVKAIREAGLESLLGEDAATAGDILRTKIEHVFGVGAFSNKGRAYFSGVATNAATTSRVAGAIFEMEYLNVTHYTFVAVDDEATTDICRHMDGKTFEVTAAAVLIDQILGAKNPDEVRKLHGWQPAKFGDVLAAQGVDVQPGVQLSEEHARKVVAAGFAFPPLHFRCRSTVDIAVTANVLTPPPLKPPAPAPPPPPPEPEPEPEPEPPPAPAPPPEGMPWRPEDLRVVGNARDLGGVTSKVELVAPDGSRWLFKPYSHRPFGYGGDTEEFRAHADVFAARLAEKLDHPTAEVHIFNLPAGHPGLDAMPSVRGHRGVTGSIQRMASSVKGEIGETALKDLTKDQLLHVQKEHALDWMISNHDGHLHNLLVKEDGGLLGIDKGQAFKYFGRDKLHWSYNPNRGGEFHGSYFNEEVERYVDGKYGRRFVLKGPAENKEFRAFLERVRDMDDDEFLDLVRPYASRASAAGVKWGGHMSEADFYAALLERKRSIVADVDGFYKEANAARKVALPPVQRKPKKPKGPKAVVELDADFVADIDRTGWAGKSLYVADVDSVKSGNVLIYGMDGDGTVLETYLTEYGDNALSATVGESFSGAVSRAAAASVSDPWKDDAVKFAKSLTAHLADSSHVVYDGKIPPHTWKEVKLHWAKLKGYSSGLYGNGGTDAEVANHYMEEWKKLIPGIDTYVHEDPDDPATVNYVAGWLQNANSKGVRLGSYVPRTPPPAAKSGRFTVRKIPTEEWKARTVNGRIQWSGQEGTEAILDRVGHGARIGESWEITTTTANPVRIVYTPHSSGAVGKAGRLRIQLLDNPSGAVTQDQIEEALGVLRDLGVRTDLASAVDMEAEYLRKVTRVAKVEDEPGFRIPRGTPSAEVVERLTAAWTTRLGKDPRKLKGYNPLPDHDDGAGWGRWYRFDVTEGDLKGYQLHAELTGFAAGDPAKFFEAALGGAPAMVASETKVRIGLPPSGMSPGEDMKTGGSWRVFTRLWEDSEPLAAGHLRFNRRAILNADNLIFKGDRYGNASQEEYDTYHMPITAANLRYLAREKKGPVDGNEVCVNQTLSFHFLEKVGCESEAQRQKILGMLRDKGWTHFSDRPIEEVIQVAGGYRY